MKCLQTYGSGANTFRKFSTPRKYHLYILNVCLQMLVTLGNCQQIENNIVRCPNEEHAQKMIDAIDAVRVKGDSVGGVVTCIARNVPKVCFGKHFTFQFLRIY